MSEFPQGLFSSLFSFTTHTLSNFHKHTITFLHHSAQFTNQTHMSEISQEGDGAAPRILGMEGMDPLHCHPGNKDQSQVGGYMKKHSTKDCAIEALEEHWDVVLACRAEDPPNSTVNQLRTDPQCSKALSDSTDGPSNCFKSWLHL